MATWEEYARTMVAPASLGTAAKDNDIPLLAALVARGADINAKDARGYSALMLAAYEGNAEACAWLLAHGADPNTRDNAGNSVLMGAAFKGHTALVRALLAAGADASALNHSQLGAREIASMFGRAEIVKLLEEHTRAATLAR